MKKYILFVFAALFIHSLNAQQFSAASQGYFSAEGDVKIVTLDSSEMIMKFDTSSVDPEEIPESFYLIKEDGSQVEYYADEILYIEIPRGEVPEEYEETEIVDLGDDYEEYNVIETTEQTKMLIYERVEVDHKQGIPLKSKYREDSYLLQLVSVGLGDRLRVYLSPNFEEGTEVAPMGELVEELSRNRVDYDEYEAYYFVKVGDAPAFRISHEEFLNLTPIIFGDCRPFRRKYSVKRQLDGDRTKKRKKTTRKDVGSKKKKSSNMRYPEFAKLVVEYHELYEVMLEEQEKKRLEKEALKANRGN